MELTEALKTIRSAYPLKGEDEKTKLLSQMMEIIKDRTSNFTEPEGLSRQKVDLKATLQKEGIKPLTWQKEKGGFERSEADTVMWLANFLSPGKKDTSQADRDRKIKILKLKAKALKLKLKLLKAA